MKRLVVVLLLLAVAAGGGYYWKIRKTAAAPEKATPTAQAERGALVVSVSSDGRVVSNLDVEIKCKASGEIVELPADVSDFVRKGSLLVRLDPVDEERSVRQAEASLAASEAELASARESLRLAEANLAVDKKRAEAAVRWAKARAEELRQKAARVADLLSRKLASREEFETADTAALQAEADLETARLKDDELAARERALDVSRQSVRVAEAGVERDRLSLENARRRLADTRVAAPMDGVVTARNVQIGQIISSPISNVGGGTTVLTLSDLSRMFVLASVDEADIGLVRLGQPARITLDAYPQQVFRGDVVRISPRGVNMSNVVTFEVKIEITDKERSLLRPEMTANAQIEVARREDALLVPNDAVVRRRGESFVRVVAPGGTPTERPVTVGVRDERRTEILDGLTAGETVEVKGGEGNGNGKWTGRPRGPMMPH